MNPARSWERDHVLAELLGGELPRRRGRLLAGEQRGDQLDQGQHGDRVEEVDADDLARAGRSPWPAS